MGMRFRKSVKICKGVKVNFSKSGASLSLGGRGHSMNFGGRGTRATVGIPGTGMVGLPIAVALGPIAPKSAAPTNHTHHRTEARRLIPDQEAMLWQFRIQFS